MDFLQSFFTILWSIWRHRNLVLYQGKTHNPIEVVLTSHSLICRYQEAFKNCQPQGHKPNLQPQRPSNRDWQLIIKVAAHRNRRTRRSGYAYEARDMEGRVIFIGGASKGGQIPYLALLEAVSEAVFKAENLGVNEIIILSNSRRLEQICNKARTPILQELTLCSDLTQFQQQGLITFSFVVPNLVLSRVIDLAFITTCFPVHLCRLNPNLL